MRRKKEPHENKRRGLSLKPLIIGMSACVVLLGGVLLWAVLGSVRLEPQSSSIEHIVCVRFLKDELQMDENRHYIIEPDAKYHVTYNVYAVHNNNLHSILFMDLRKIVGTDILDSCIERYGFVTVMVSILHELSNSGYAYSQRKEEINNVLKITEKEILDSSESFISFDDFSESLGFSERSQEEIEFVQKVHKHVFF